MEGFTRREFMARSALWSAGAAGTAGLGGGLLIPTKADAAKIKFVEPSCPAPRGSGPKILVAYGSRCGSTGGVAEAIGRVLCQKGASVDVRLVDHVKDPGAYDAVIVGSAVRRGSWLYEAIDFVRKNKDILDKKPTAFFLTCLCLSRPGDQTRRLAKKYMDSVLRTVPQVKPRALGYFAGALDYSKIGFMMRGIMRSKMAEKGIKEGDYRNFAAIRAWTGSLPLQMGLKARAVGS